MWCRIFLIQCPAEPISPNVKRRSRPNSGYFSKSGTTGNIVMDAAAPLSQLAPADATHDAPISASEAVRVGAGNPSTIMPYSDSATMRAITAEGMPVRGGEGVMGVPRLLFRGREMGWGGANAMPTAKRLRKRGFW